MKLAFWKPHKYPRDIFMKFVCWWTKSPYAHVELIIDGVCYSSSILDRGVRRKVIDLSGDHWEVVGIDWAFKRKNQIIDFFTKTSGEHYGYFDLITNHIFNLPFQQKKGWTCSEWVAAALKLPAPERWNPGNLYNYCKERL